MDEQTEFYESYNQYFSKLVGYKLGLPPKHEQTQECVHQGWVDIFKSWDTFRGMSTRKSWAYTIMQRAAYRYIKKLQTHRTCVARYFMQYGIGMDEEMSNPLALIMDHSDHFRYRDVEYNLIDFEELRKVIPIPNSQMDVLKGLVNELTCEEIADKLGISINAVYVRSFKLRKRLSHFFDDVPLNPDNVE